MGPADGVEWRHMNHKMRLANGSPTQLQNEGCRDHKSMHGWFKELLNGLHVIGEIVDNHDMIRYILKTFIEHFGLRWWTFKVSHDLSTIKLMIPFVKWNYMNTY